MSALRRRLFNLLTALSLLLCVAVCGLWVRSYWAIDRLDRRHADAVHARSMRGRLVVLVVRHDRQPYRAEFVGWELSREPPLGAAEAAAFASAAPPAGTKRHWRALGFEYLRGEPPTPGRLLNGAWGAPAWRVAVPHWSAAVATAALPLAAAVRAVRARSRRARGLCRSCGYDLRASPDRCPECGVAAIPTAP